MLGGGWLGVQLGQPGVLLLRRLGPRGPRGWRSPCSDALVWACSSDDVSALNRGTPDPIASPVSSALRRAGFAEISSLPVQFATANVSTSACEGFNTGRPGP
jgi:hypothetical protein